MGPNISASSGSGKPFEAGEEGGRGITAHSNYIHGCMYPVVNVLCNVAMSMVRIILLL